MTQRIQFDNSRARTYRKRQEVLREGWVIVPLSRGPVEVLVGGIRTLGYLDRIEKLRRPHHGGSEDFRLSHYLDLIAGRSTGPFCTGELIRSSGS